MAKIVKVIIPDNIRPYPEAHEVDIAWILARHYKAVVEFLQPSLAYKIKTPDIVMNGIMWEIKSPTGSSRKFTVQYQFKGLEQSRNLIIDGRRTKLDDDHIKKQIQKEKKSRKRVGRLIFITNKLKIIEL